MTTTPAAMPTSHRQPASWAGKLRQSLGKLAVPILVLLGGAVVWTALAGGWSKDDRDALPPEDLTSSADSVRLMVTAEPIAFRPVQRVVEAVGTMHGFEEVTIAAKVEGRILRIHHEVADRVAPEELLAEVDPTDYDLASKQAANSLQVELAKLGLRELPDANFDLSKVPTVMLSQVRVDNTRSRMERLQRVAGNAASQGELENAVNEFRIAQADHANQLLLAKAGLAMIGLRQSDLAMANQHRADTQIRSPRPHRPIAALPGGVMYVITRRSVSEGSLVRAGGEICTLAIDGVLKLRVPIPERYSAQIELGQKADVFTSAFPDPFPGVVTLINPAVAPATRTFDVEIQVANDRGVLKPGSFAKAIIQTGEPEEAATAPLSALVTFAGVTKVFLAENGLAKEVLVVPGVQTRQWVEIAKPKLAPGAVVVTSGQSVLADETPIAIRQPESSAAREKGQP